MTTSPPASSPTPVAQIPAAPSAEAAAHFDALLRFETDCWDVHESLKSPDPDFVLLQVNSTQQSFDAAHIDGARFLHHSTISEATLAEYPADTLFVVYCSGPHCNGADRGALRLAQLGRPVKKMIGGVMGWLDEGFHLTASE